MNEFQRAWRSVMRKPVKSIALFLAIGVISLFLLTAMAAHSANIKAQDSTRKAVGAGLLLEENRENRTKRMEELRSQLKEGEEGTVGGYHQEKIIVDGVESWYTWTDHSFETLKMKDIETIAAVPGVLDYNISTVPTAVHPVDFERIEDKDVDQSSDSGGVTLIGNRDMRMDSNVLSNNVTLKEGRMVEPGDENVCVISWELAQQNQTAVGDILQFCPDQESDSGTVYEAKVIGIYQTKQDMAPYMTGDTYRSENVIFTDLRFPEKAEGHEEDPLFLRAYFQVDPERYEEVKETVQKVDIEWERYDFIDNNGNLTAMSSNFNDLEKISELLLWAVMGAGFVILCLIFLFWIRNRNREVGILLSLGMAKGNILGQIGIEAAVIGAAALAVSFALAPGIAGHGAEYLVRQQEEAMKQENTADYGTAIATDQEEPELTVTQIKTEITPVMMAADGIGIAVLIGGAVSAAGISVMRRKPREILSMEE